MHLQKALDAEKGFYLGRFICVFIHILGRFICQEIEFIYLYTENYLFMYKFAFGARDVQGP